MKKILSVFILTVTVAIGCSSSKKADDTSASAEKKGAGLEFEYTAITRGSYKQIIAKQTGVTFVKERDAKPETVAISTADWNAMVDFYENNIAKKSVKLEDIQVPSKKHQYDGALAATLTVKVADQLYTTPTFDHGNPPAEVKGLVDEMVKLAGLETKK